MGMNLFEIQLPVTENTNFEQENNCLKRSEFCFRVVKFGIKVTMKISSKLYICNKILKFDQTKLPQNGGMVKK
jgi:hypothetical protein